MVDPQSGQARYYKIGIYCFSPKHAALKSMNKDWLAENRKYVSKNGEKCLPVNCCFSELAQKIQLGMLVKYKMDILTISSVCSYYDKAEK